MRALRHSTLCPPRGHPTRVRELAIRSRDYWTRPAMYALSPLRRSPSVCDRTTIVPFGGLGDLRFGSGPQRVRSYLGEPTAIEWPSEVGSRFLWEYQNEMLRVYFDPHGGDYLLTGLSVGSLEAEPTVSSKMTFAGAPVLGVREAELIERLAARGVRFCAEAHWNSVYFTAFTHGVGLTTDNGIVIAFSWGVRPAPDEEKGTPWQHGFALEWSLERAIR